MKRLAAVALPALALAFAQPALSNDTAAAGQPQATQSYPDQTRALPTAPSSEAAPTQNRSAEPPDRAQDRTGKTDAQDKGKQHGPTAVMNRATPSEKAKGPASAGKHPPARVMERATPDLSAPGTAKGEDNPSSVSGETAK